jgi:predicted nucleic acid-binding protein
MKPMSAKEFTDTNIIIYGLGQDRRKKTIAIDIIKNRPTVSTQVLGELSHTLSRKFHLAFGKISTLIDFLIKHCEVKVIDIITVKKALTIAEKYNYSYYDSLILASALESQCNILYSEDMQHGQVINNSLTIKNPFIL